MEIDQYTQKILNDKLKDKFTLEADFTDIILSTFPKILTRNTQGDIFLKFIVETCDISFINKIISLDNISALFNDACDDLRDQVEGKKSGIISFLENNGFSQNQINFLTD